MYASNQLARPRRPVSLWRTAVGWALVCAGILGMILPIIPGVPLLIGGLVILSARYRWAAVGLRWLKRKVRQVADRKKQKETAGASC